MRRDRLAAAGVGTLLARVRGHCRGALGVERLGRLDRGEDLRLVEQHLLLIRRDTRLGEPFRGAAEELALQPPHLLLEQSLALDRLAQFRLQPLIGLPELSEGLFRDLQP